MGSLTPPRHNIINKPWILRLVDHLNSSTRWYRSIRRQHARIDEFRHLINHKKDIFETMFTLRGGIARTKYGLLHPGLFSKAMGGTKYLVEEYNRMICEGLDFVCNANVMQGDEPIPSDAR
jgi:TAG lipase/steryl ester hydrolase/phospholipase A2/LPA acyltransferase